MSDLSRREFLYRGGLLGGGLAIGALGVAGCSSSSKGSKGGGQVGLSMMSHEGDVAKFLDKRAKELSSASGAQYKYSPIKLTVQPLQQIVPKALADFSSHHDIPDILAIEINAFSQYMKNNVASTVLADLTPKIGDLNSLYTAAATKPYTLDGKVYALGCDYPLMTYYYREDLASQLGIKFPIDTWEDLLDIGRTVAKPKGMYMGTLATGKGGVGTQGISAQFISWLVQRGGAIFSEDGNTVTLDSPEAVDVMTFMATALKENIMLGVDALFGPAEVAAFKNNKIVGHEGADWWKFMITRNLQDEYGKWKMVEMPRWKGGGAATATSGGTGYAVTKQSKNQDAAWQLLKESLMTPQGEREKFPQLSFLPVLKSAYQDSFFTSYKDPVFGGQQTFELYAKLAPQAAIQPQSQYWQFALQALDRACAAVYGGKNPASAVTDAANAIKKNISQGG